LPRLASALVFIWALGPIICFNFRPTAIWLLYLLDWRFHSWLPAQRTHVGMAWRLWAVESFLCHQYTCSSFVGPTQNFSTVVMPDKSKFP
jgi:hypothetical protein